MNEWMNEFYTKPYYTGIRPWCGLCDTTSKFNLFNNNSNSLVDNTVSQVWTSNRCWKVKSTSLDWKHLAIFTLKYSIFLHLRTLHPAGSAFLVTLTGNHSFFSSWTKLIPGTPSLDSYIMFWVPWSSGNWLPVIPAPFSAPYHQMVPSLH